MTQQEKEIRKIHKKTVTNMQALGTYKEEFVVSVRRYAELRYQYSVLNEQWAEDDYRITEEYTNKAGATNRRKTALYLALETMRKDLLELENLFGLTPKGLKAIKSKGLDAARGSALDEVLKNVGS